MICNNNARTLSYKRDVVESHRYQIERLGSPEEHMPSRLSLGSTENIDVVFGENSAVQIVSLRTDWVAIENGK